MLSPDGESKRSRPRARAGQRVLGLGLPGLPDLSASKGDAPRPQPVGAVPPGPLPPRQEAQRTSEPSFLPNSRIQQSKLEPRSKSWVKQSNMSHAIGNTASAPHELEQTEL